MFRHLSGIFLGIALLCQTGVALAAGDPNDAEGSKDPSIFSRMPGFYISDYEETQFDRYEFQVNADKKEAVEGHSYIVSYYANDNITLPSGLQITRNYTNAAKAAGGKAVYEFEDGGYQIATMKVVKGNAEIWARVEAANNGMYHINVVERQLMNQDVVADASSMASSIKETGKAAVYGIYFDTGKSDIKAESAPALAEIAKMLQANAAMKLYVVGHTDNVGTFDSNIKLSNSRADAVVKELTTKYSVTAARLQAFGAGPTSPAASNLTEEGRAKNRRVELVAQ
jgi:OmpA-OmpF porin, OOP family